MSRVFVTTQCTLNITNTETEISQIVTYYQTALLDDLDNLVS